MIKMTNPIFAVMLRNLRKGRAQSLRGYNFVPRKYLSFFLLPDSSDLEDAVKLIKPDQIAVCKDGKLVCWIDKDKLSVDMIKAAMEFRKPCRSK